MYLQTWMCYLTGLLQRISELEACLTTLDECDYMKQIIRNLSAENEMLQQTIAKLETSLQSKDKEIEVRDEALFGGLEMLKKEREEHGSLLCNMRAELDKAEKARKLAEAEVEKVKKSVNETAKALAESEIEKISLMAEVEKVKKSAKALADTEIEKISLMAEVELAENRKKFEVALASVKEERDSLANELIFNCENTGICLANDTLTSDSHDVSISELKREIEKLKCEKNSRNSLSTVKFNKCN